MNLTLTDEDAKALALALGYHLAGLRTELAHTDSRAFRDSLRKDIERLEAIEKQVRALFGERRRPGRQPL